MSLLNEFAQSTRYHNLNALSSSKAGSDPLSQWSRILFKVLEEDVTKGKRDKILTKYSLFAKKIDDITVTVMHDLEQNPMSTEDALAMPGLHDESAKHVVLYIIKIMNPLKELISNISHAAYGRGDGEPPFPQMQEFLEWLWDDRAHVLKKSGGREMPNRVAKDV